MRLTELKLLDRMAEMFSQEKEAQYKDLSSGEFIIEVVSESRLVC